MSRRRRQSVDPRQHEILFVQASYPRSGTTWVSLLLGHHYGIGMISVYDSEITGKTQKRLAWVRDPLHQIERVAMKTHEGGPPAGCESLPSMLVVRDGRDAIVSHAHYLIDFGGRRGRIQDIMLGLAASPWWSNMFSKWLARGAVIIRYEDMVVDPLGALESCMARVLPEARPINREPLPITFDAAHGATPTFFRRGVVGAWRDEMPVNVQNVFWQNHREMMEAHGYGG